MSIRAVLAAALLAAATAVAVPGAAVATPNVAAPGSEFTAVTPQRVLDTRDGTGVATQAGHFVLDLSAELPAGATAVVLNLTGADATEDSFVTAWPDGQVLDGGLTVPNSSNLNVSKGQTAANLTTVAVPATRKIDLYVHGRLALIADLSGFYAPATGSGYTSQSPQRVLDTRTGPGPVGPNGTITLDLSSALPATATAVVLNLTATDTSDSTYVAAWPDGSARPSATVLNLVPGQTRANLVTVAVPPSRKIDLYNHVGTVDLIADLSGYYTTGGGQPFFPYAPLRLADTRTGSPIGPDGLLYANAVQQVPLTASALVANITATDATAATYLTAWPGSQQRPSASTLNLGPGETVPNMAIVSARKDSEGSSVEFDVYNHVGKVDVIVDLAGYFAPAVAACTVGCPVGWGENEHGGLGTGTAGAQESRPAPVVGLSNIAAIAGAEDNGAALDSTGRVWTWGLNNHMQDGNGTSLFAPVPALSMPGQATAIAFGGDTGYALKSDGTVWEWGQDGTQATGFSYGFPTQIGGLTGVTAIAATAIGGYALKSDGTVWGWGAADLGNTTTAYDKPQQVDGLTGVTAIGGGAATAYALKTDGTVWAWGDDQYGARGATGTGKWTTPNQVQGLSGVTGLATSYSSGTGYAVKADGTVWSWGRNDFGQTGTGNTQLYFVPPTQVVGLTGVKAVAAGSVFAQALKSDGTVWSWGFDHYGELGVPGADSAVPAQVPGLTGVTSVGTAGERAFAVLG